MNKSRGMRWAGHVARVGQNRNAYRISVGKSEGKRLQGKLIYRWQIIIKMILEKNDGMVRTGFIWLQDRDQWQDVVKMIMDLRSP
jgi:hypothetical protein